MSFKILGVSMLVLASALAHAESPEAVAYRAGCDEEFKGQIDAIDEDRDYFKQAFEAKTRQWNAIHLGATQLEKDILNLEQELKSLPARKAKIAETLRTCRKAQPDSQPLCQEQSDAARLDLGRNTSKSQAELDLKRATLELFKTGQDKKAWNQILLRLAKLRVEWDNATDKLGLAIAGLDECRKDADKLGSLLGEKPLTAPYASNEKALPLESSGTVQGDAKTSSLRSGTALPVELHI